MANCDKCGRENPIADWSNFCPDCRLAFHKRSNTARHDDAKRSDAYWRERGYSSAPTGEICPACLGGPGAGGCVCR